MCSVTHPPYRAYDLGVTDYTELVAQAMKLVSVQAGCPVEDALSMVNDRALVWHISLVEMAQEIVDGLVTFGP